MIQSCKVMYLGTISTVDKKSRAQSSPATMSTVPTAAQGRKMKKISTSSTSTTPYSVCYLRTRRRRRYNDLRRNSASLSTETTATDLQKLEECFEDCSSGGGEVIVTSGCINDDLTATASCCSSNCASSSCERDVEVVEEYTTTSETVADPEVESDETSTRLHEYCEAPRESEFQTSKSTVQNKMPSQSEIDDFFNAAEKNIQKRFLDKYNFDTVNDLPIEGRYEWVQVKP